MKYILTVVIVLFLGLLLYGVVGRTSVTSIRKMDADPPTSATEGGPSHSEFTEYVSEKGYRLKYPVGWTVTKRDAIDTYGGGATIYETGAFTPAAGDEVDAGLSIRTQLKKSDASYIMTDLFLTEFGGRSDVANFLTSKKLIEYTVDDVLIKNATVQEIEADTDATNPYSTAVIDVPDAGKAGIVRFIIINNESFHYTPAIAVTYVAPTKAYDERIAKTLLSSFQLDESTQ